MNRKELIEHISKLEPELTYSRAHQAVNAIVECLADALAGGEPVTLRGFGTFKLCRREARNGRNPRTGKEIRIPASKAVRFLASAELKKAIKGKA